MKGEEEAKAESKEQNKRKEYIYAGNLHLLNLFWSKKRSNGCVGVTARLE